MYSGKLVFSQLMDFLPMHKFRQCVNKYQGNYHIRSFSCLDQFLCMAFAQLSYRESLRDIESCLRAMQNKLYHIGIRGRFLKAHCPMLTKIVISAYMQILPNMVNTITASFISPSIQMDSQFRFHEAAKIISCYFPYIQPHYFKQFFRCYLNLLEKLNYLGYTYIYVHGVSPFFLVLVVNSSIGRYAFFVSFKIYTIDFTLPIYILKKVMVSICYLFRIRH